MNPLLLLFLTSVTVFEIVETPLKDGTFRSTHYNGFANLLQEIRLQLDHSMIRFATGSTRENIRCIRHSIQGPRVENLLKNYKILGISNY
jgi:hypothetical protein